MLLFIFLIQLFLYVLKSGQFGSGGAEFQPDLSAQSRIDSMILLYESEASIELRPFNPNYISDFKGYMLGMSPQEIDKLHAYRKSGKFLESVEEFQRITGVTDSLLFTMAGYFKFPSRDPFSSKTDQILNALDRDLNDLNSATPDELKRIRGIGEVLSARIVKFRESLGGFLVAEQLYDVYGLEKAVADRVMERFAVLRKPQIKRIDLNRASAEEIGSLLYITKPMARAIVTYRHTHGPIENWDELTKIEGFPIHQIDRIKLYLTL